MRFLVVGLGSMGKRRIRNLIALGNKDIIGFDPRKDRRIESELKYQITTFSSIDKALKKGPDAMIISTPPDLHSIYANIAISNNIHFFTEVNLSSADIQQIIKKLKKRQIVGVPSCTMIFHPIIKQLKKLFDKREIGKVLLVQHHFGHYLPHWHPWEDYRQFYVSKRETGAAREIVPFELVWLEYLFRNVKSVYGDIKKISKLDANIDDIYQILLEFDSKVLCNMTIDVVTRPSVKETKIIGENGIIICDYNTGEIKIGKDTGWKVLKLKMGKVAKGYKGNTAPETLYEEEMTSFIKAIKNKRRYPQSFDDELRILTTLDLIEESSKKGKRILL